MAKKHRRLIEIPADEIPDGAITISTIDPATDEQPGTFVELPTETCPVCDGEGVPKYGPTNVECKACLASGIVPTLGGVKRLVERMRTEKLGNTRRRDETIELRDGVTTLLSHDPSYLRKFLLGSPDPIVSEHVNELDDVSLRVYILAKIFPKFDEEIEVYERNLKVLTQELALAENLLERVRSIHRYANEVKQLETSFVEQPVQPQPVEIKTCYVCGKEAREWDAEGVGFCRQHAHEYGLHGADEEEEDDEG